jgi:mRNA (guanine-N7-)-methyltransferase
LCCGKGGDLNKWTNAGASYLVAADIAHRSVEHLIARYRSSGKGRRPSYGLLPLSGDLCHVDLSAYLPPALFFDFVSCQFAFHYSFESHERARRLMANAAGRLKPGGYFVGTVPDDAVLMSKLRAAPGMEFGNDLYRVAFQTPHKGPFTDSFGIRYLFTLRDAVESCPEYLVPLPALRQLGEEAGLELLHCENLHEFFYRHASSPALYPVLARMRTIPFRHPVPADQWDAVYIYRIFIFRKRDGPLPPSPAATTWPPTPPEPIVMTS